ncbi:Crp/Fnr family transcriptional regulator [Thioalkalivibrio paradoxus ARh 1]|uniref:Crp/Fnr family transcriptional regulator n=2 Tax=Thioalkalivibrio paradoxus TaxID=108010 RepID=W0DKR8_9GAMM|nr:Crp/Fnr family transcriptional regulator [Thioalkalivibrio paradoxus ARh 1]
MPFAAVGPQRFGRLLLKVENFLPPANVVLYKAGDSANAVFTVRWGFIKVWAEDELGHPRILRLLGPGDMLGLEALVESHYDHSATTLTPAGLCRTPEDIFGDLLCREPALHAQLQQRWLSQLRRTDQFLLKVGAGTSRDRVLKLLRWLAEFSHPHPCPRLSRNDMAAMLNISSETAARVIATLKRRGTLSETDSEMHFDPDRLSL